MNIVQLIIMEKDRGYAWVILGASTILMGIGPSTFTSSGFLLNNITLSPENQEWILNVFYIFWVFSALLASCFAKERPRQLAITGSAIATVGFISSASAVKDPKWLYLTFSMGVGFGLGLSFHTAYLVVMSNFDRFKGLANGVCQFCIVLGHIVTPYLFTAVKMPKDRFQVRSLTTAVGFLTALFFVVPIPPPAKATIVGDRNRRFSTASRRGSQGEAAVPLHSGFIPIPPNNNAPISQVRTRRRSQYLLQVSTSLLPNIPEEPESTHSTNDTVTSASSDSDVSNIAPLGSLTSTFISQDHIKKAESEATEESKRRKTNSESGNGIALTPKTNSHVPLRRLSEGCLPHGANVVPLPLTEANVNSNINVNPKPVISYGNGIPRTVSTPRVRRFSESQLESSKSQVKSQSQTVGNYPLTSSKSHQDLQSRSMTSANNSKPVVEKEPEQTAKQVATTKGESILDFSLLRDFHFLNMAAFSSLCTVTVVNFPVVFYVYIVTRCVTDCIHEANVALTIIYLVDLISRFVFSYLSDLAFLSRRTGFLIGCGVVGIIIAVTPLSENPVPIYFISAIYGLCIGLLASCQYLMFIESFGLDKFLRAYGYINLMKLLVVLVLGIFSVNPLFVHLYPVHPFNQFIYGGNNTYIDPLEILQTEVDDNSKDTVTVVRLLIGIAIPSILCALAWITEDIYKASQRCSSSPSNSKMQTASTNNPTSDAP